MAKLFLPAYLFLILTSIQSCRTAEKSVKKRILVEDLTTAEKTPVPDASSSTSKTTDEKDKKGALNPGFFYDLLSHAGSIKILAFSLESGDLATELFRGKLGGIEIKILLSESSALKARSRKRYFDRVGIEVGQVRFPSHLADHGFIILDENIVLRNIHTLINRNENPKIIPITLTSEFTLWSGCLEDPVSCHRIISSAFLGAPAGEIDAPQTKGAAKKQIRWNLPPKTKLEEFVEETR